MGRFVRFIESGDDEFCIVVICHVHVLHFVVDDGLALEQLHFRLLNLSEQNIAVQLPALLTKPLRNQVDGVVNGPNRHR